MEMLDARSGLPPDLELKRSAWDRQPCESRKAFDAFVIYRDLPDNRRLQVVADELHCSGANIRRWSSRWSWFSRAQEWDIFQDQAVQEAQVRERRRMAERHAHTAVLLQDIAMEEAAKLRQRLENGVLDEKSGKIVDFTLSAGEIARLYEIGTLAERRARGENDEEQVAKIEVIFARKQPVTAEDEPPLLVPD